MTLRFLGRDWRGGELGVLLSALILAVAVVVGISAFVSRLQGALLSESARFLAADLVVSSATEPPDEWLMQAQAEALSVSQTLAFPSMLVGEGDDMVMVSVKAVAPAYPLKGTLQISDNAFSEVRTASDIPALGEIWLAPRLFALMDLSPGDTVMVGEAALRVAGAIRGEPDATTGVFGFGPRVMMNLADIERTGVIQPGSRVRYRFLLSGEVDALEKFEAWVKPLLSQGQGVQSVKQSQPRIGDTLDRAQGFLLLAGSLGVVLAAAAIALAARRFGERHTQYVAIMKSLGAQSVVIDQLYRRSLLMLGCLATALGCAVGWGIQEAFITVLDTLLPFQPGAVGWKPFAIGGVTSAVCLGLFAWPPLRRLSEATPLRVFRQDIGFDHAQRPLDHLLGALALVGLMWWYSNDLTVTLAVVAGLLLVVLAGWQLARWLLRGSRRIGGFAGSIWRLALAGLQRGGNGNAMQMVIFAIAIMLMLLLTVVRSSLIGQWQAQLPAGSPNHFLLNLAPEEREPLQTFFNDNALRSEALYPMTRGRVVEVNQQTLPEWDEVETGPRQREANFTWSSVLPPDNILVQGEWWQAGTEDQVVSLEQEFARELGVSLGDHLTLRVGAHSFSARVTSVRKVDWQSMKPNFFMVFPEAVLERFPGMYMTSFFLPPERKSALNRLIRQFPTLTVVELDLVIKEMRSIVDQVARALELVLAVILLAGSLVLIAGVQSSIDTRMQESALLRALGAGRQLILGSLWIEFAVLGALAGALAAAGAELAAWALQTRVFEIVWQPTLLLWLTGPLVGAVVVGGLGVWSCRRIVSTPPMHLLREV